LQLSNIHGILRAQAGYWMLWSRENDKALVAPGKTKEID